MLKKITRRSFVSSLSVLAAMPLLSPRVARAATGKTVSVNQYNNNDWIAAFKQAFNEGDTVVVPAGLTCKDINTGIFIPDGKTLLIRGALSGNGWGRFVLQEGSKVIGEGEGRTENITLDVRGSDCVIKGLAMSGFGPVTQIYIGGKKPSVMRNLVIDNIRVSQANYAILRQGFHNQVDGARITNSKFSHLQGDAIEWNVAINDRNILISDHVIDNINCTNGKINWGIGIKSIKNKKIVMFAPTFRMNNEDIRYSDGAEIIDNNFLRVNDFCMEEIDYYLEQSNLHLILKLHPYEEEYFRGIATLSSNITIISSDELTQKNIDLNQLLSLVDILITDYSSIYLDYLILNKPLIFLVPDVDAYSSARGGFTLEPFDFWTPGDKVSCQRSLLNSINKIITGNDEYAEKRNQINLIINKYSDANNSQRVIELMKSLS